MHEMPWYVLYQTTDGQLNQMLTKIEIIQNRFQKFKIHFIPL